MQTPVALIIFKRPDTTKAVIDAIRQAKPERLFIIADGPRKDRPKENSLCEQARAVAEDVDWPCTITKIYSQTNLGCKNRVASGISEVFTYVDRTIILEDDCVPSQSFFIYCEELLEKYCNDTRIMTISGNNQLFGQTAIDESYYFSRYAHMWGWATWKRAWNLCDLEMQGWPAFRNGNNLRNLFDRAAERYYWRDLLDYVCAGKIDTWDYQWVYSIWAQNGLSIVPKCNLVANVGFNEQATHTKSESRYASLPAEDLSFPMIHPISVYPNYKLDQLECRGRERNGFPYPLNRFAKFLKRKLCRDL